MSTLQITALVVLISIGSFCAGIMVMLDKLFKWRIEWIELEHDLARLQGREPREIDHLNDPVPDQINKQAQCDFWFRLCNEEFDRAIDAFSRNDLDAFNESAKKHSLLSVRFKREREHHYE